MLVDDVVEVVIGVIIVDELAVDVVIGSIVIAPMVLVVEFVLYRILLLFFYNDLLVSFFFAICYSIWRELSHSCLERHVETVR